MAGFRSPPQENIRGPRPDHRRRFDKRSGTLLSVYADSSFLVSLYVEDSHSAATKGRMRQNSRVWFTPLNLAECWHAIAKQVFCRNLSQTAADTVFEMLQRDLADGLYLEVALPENAFILCAELGRRHGPKLGMRALDTLHVACAVELEAERFWTFDERQLKLAKTVGLKIG